MTWMELCILEDKLQRCLLCLPGSYIGDSAARIGRSLQHLALELCNDAAAMAPVMRRQPKWLAFQARTYRVARV